MSDIAPLTTFRVGDTECVVLTRAQFDLIMAAVDDRMDAAAAAQALAELDGREADLLTAAEFAEMSRSPLRFWRRRRGLTQAALAARAGISRARLAEIERGRKDGGLKVMVRIADALDVTLDDLAG